MNKRVQDFNKAIGNLQTALTWDTKDMQDAVKESTIKRFELCYDLAWKCIKDYAKSQGSECYSPKECFKTAFQLGLIDDNEDWAKNIVEDRNLSSHVYNEQIANDLYKRIPKYLEMFQGLYKKLSGFN